MPWSLPHLTMERKETDVHHIPLDSQDEAVKRFFLTLPVDSQGSVVELNGQAVACLLPVSAGAAKDNGAWTEAKNERRCDLIDKEIDGTLTAVEAIELRGLQQAMLQYRRRVAPLPLEGARRLHQELLAKAGRKAKK